MISPLRGSGRRIFFRAFALAVLVALLLKWYAVQPATTVATFNIEDFPRSDAQIEGAFETIASLEASLVAVQEITNPKVFRREAHRRLGERWRFVTIEEGPYHRPGVLLDRTRLALDDVDVHDETVVHDGGRPVLEIEATADSGRALEVFVVHFKAGSDGLPFRREQYAELATILRDHDTPERTTVLAGDFNSTSLSDYRLLDQLADATSLQWTTRETECTGYWEPGDTCESFALDHVLVEGVGARAISRGPCRSVGCDPGGTCPVFHRRVSDHCPVTAQLIPR